MELIKLDRGEFVEVLASGRLDEHWANHLQRCLDEVIREGTHRIQLNMSSVTYLSSAGISVLVTFYKQLKDIDGSFAVVEPSEMVLKILDLTLLSPMLVAKSGAAGSPGRSGIRPMRRIEKAGAEFEVLELKPGASLLCRVLGDPSLLVNCGFRERDAITVTFDEAKLGLGLGAFGSSFGDCQSRYGEFLAVAGAASYLPTDGSSVPDYLVSVGQLVPDMSVLYGLVCEGAFANLARFEASKQSRAVKLSEIARTALEIANTDAAAVVMVAEIAGLVGASLRKSPASGLPQAPEWFTFPEIRRWISFTAEPAYAGSQCLIVGVVAGTSISPLAGMLRPLSANNSLTGHFHAAVFQYRPIKKGEIDMNATVKSLMEAHSLQGMLHLLSDHREASGAGESEFIRGACWIGGIREILAGGI